MDIIKLGGPIFLKPSPELAADKFSNGAINMTLVEEIRLINIPATGSDKFGIRFNCIGGSNCRWVYDTEVDRDTEYEALLSAFPPMGP